MPDALTIAMEVQRDGYWDGQYPRVGDVIRVPEPFVEALTRDGFAVVQDQPAAPPPPKKKGSPHGR
jgi:hypothetical protein